MLNDFLSLGADQSTIYTRLTPASSASPTCSATTSEWSAADPGLKEGVDGGYHGDASHGSASGDKPAFLAQLTTIKMFDFAGRLWQVRAALQSQAAGRSAACAATGQQRFVQC